MRFGATSCAGIVCVLAVVSVHCGGKSAPAAPSAPSSPSTPTPSPSASPAPAGTFTVTCGTTTIDLAWSGVDTRACTITSANGFDGDVALSCSGLPSASCEFDPPIVRVAPIAGSRLRSATQRACRSACSTPRRRVPLARIDDRDDDR